MSKVYYLVCHSKEIAVCIGDSAGDGVAVWVEQIAHVNNFLNITLGENIVMINDEQPEFPDFLDDYIVLGQID